MKYKCIRKEAPEGRMYILNMHDENRKVWIYINQLTNYTIK